MAGIERRYNKEEFARRGDEVYERKVRPHLTAKDLGRLVAVDIVTGEYEIGDDELEVCSLLRARVPESQTWLVRVGSRYVHRLGGRIRLRQP
jgi:hypothetical protein